MRIRVLLAVSMIVFCGSSYAQSLSEQKVTEELLQHMEINKMFDYLKQGYLLRIKEMREADLDVSKMTKEELAKEEESYKKLEELVNKELTLDKMKLSFTKVIKEVFTAEERAEMVHSLRSPAETADEGRKSEWSRRFMEAGLKSMNDIMLPVLGKAAEEERGEAVAGDRPSSEKTGGYPLHEAVRTGNPSKVRELLARGEDVNRKDSSGWTSLAIAVKWNNLEMVHVLLERGADVQAQNKDGGTALHVAAMEGNVAIADMLLSSGANPEAESEAGARMTPLMQAAAWKRVGVAELLLKKGAGANTRTTRGTTPLFFAITTSPSFAMAKLLVDYGANVHEVDESGMTTLIASLLNHPGDPGTVKLFLDHGVDVNARMTGGNHLKFLQGTTALHHVISPPEADIAEILLSRGADVNAKDAKGVTPLGLALDFQRTVSRFDYNPLIELLRRYGGHE